MSRLFVRFVKSESGATAIEYGLIAAGISLAIMVAVQTIGNNMAATFTTLSNAMTR